MLLASRDPAFLGFLVLVNSPALTAGLFRVGLGCY